MSLKRNLLVLLTKSVLEIASKDGGKRPPDCDGPFYRPKPPVMTEEAEKKLKEVLR